MKTPIVDFVKKYAENSDTVRMHMPGHKGVSLLESNTAGAKTKIQPQTSIDGFGHTIGITGPEMYDITEIPGADSLYEADGIIAESENYASELFGARTFYSTEGSSLCIRAMLYLAMVNRGMRKPWILAGRNAHKTFLSAVALLDLDVEWLYPK